MKTAFDFGRAYAEWLRAEGMEFPKQTQRTADIPDSDCRDMGSAGVEADPAKYWRGYNSVVATSNAARALRSIPSETRAQASRTNGGKGDPESHRRGGRPRITKP